MMVQNPLSTFLDQQQRVLTQGCRATDNYSYTLFSKGMTGRLGTESNPSAPLLFRHVLYMDQVFNTNFLNAATAETQRRWALAGLANLLLWLGWWLRSMETFSWEERRKRRSSQPIDKQYSKWSYAERLYITLFCQ
jgi:hypothetical protein